VTIPMRKCPHTWMHVRQPLRYGETCIASFRRCIARRLSHNSKRRRCGRLEAEEAAVAGALRERGKFPWWQLPGGVRSLRRCRFQMRVDMSHIRLHMSHIRPHMSHIRLHMSLYVLICPRCVRLLGCCMPPYVSIRVLACPICVLICPICVLICPICVLICPIRVLICPIRVLACPICVLICPNMSYTCPIMSHMCPHMSHMCPYMSHMCPDMSETFCAAGFSDAACPRVAAGTNSQLYSLPWLCMHMY